MTHERSWARTYRKTCKLNSGSLFEVLQKSEKVGYSRVSLLSYYCRTNTLNSTTGSSFIYSLLVTLWVLGILDPSCSVLLSCARDLPSIHPSLKTTPVFACRRRRCPSQPLTDLLSQSDASNWVSARDEVRSILEVEWPRPCPSTVVFR